MRLPAPFYAAREHIGIDLPGAGVLFTTRRGGFSDGPYATLNLGHGTDDRPESVRRNRASLCGSLGVRFAFGRQVHGTTVRRVTEPPEEGSQLLEGDGQATELRGVAPMVLTADCLPIALAGAGVVAMLHAGWRGLAAGVVREGVRSIRELGGLGPLSAAVGPGAGPCCYAVGDEVRAAFGPDLGPARGSGNLDLKAIAHAELRHAGVGVVHDVEICTICADAGMFYSHRRDHGVTGRQAGIAWLS